MRLIDADALLETIANKLPKWGFKAIDMHVVETLIKNEPTISQWIPVSERLPNADEMFNCLYVNEYGDYITNACIYEVGGIYDCENDYTILCNVVAWMPLPEPYKESEEE